MNFYFNNKVLLALLFFSTSLVLNAQQKVGTNPTTISTNTNLEVEATNGSKLKVSSDTGKVTIADGTQGTGKFLVSDSNGTGTWTDLGNTTVTVDGVVNTPSVTYTFSSSTYSNMGLSINIPKAGVYSVKASLFFGYLTGCQDIFIKWTGTNIASQSFFEKRQLCGTPSADWWNANWIIVATGAGTIQLQGYVGAGNPVTISITGGNAISLN